MPITNHCTQPPADVAVVTQTILRPSLLRSARSVFGQQQVPRIHFLIGIDVAAGDPGILEAIQAECPAHVMLTVLDLGYSTSQRHGGVYSNAYGGALRAILTLAANSTKVAYLDDNDWYAPDHLAVLLRAIAGHDWAFSHRWLVDPATGWAICPDEWDSVGPGRGINQEQFGGFCQPSTLMLDKLACQGVVPLWANAAFPDGGGEDRLVFEALRRRPFGMCPQATCFCTLSAEAVTHPHHIAEFERRGFRWVRDRDLVGQFARHLQEARTALAEGRAADALVASNAAIAIHRDQPDALRLAAQSLTALGHADKTAAFLARVDLLEFGLRQT